MGRNRGPPLGSGRSCVSSKGHGFPLKRPVSDKSYHSCFVFYLLGRGPNEGKGVRSLGDTVTSTKRMVADWRDEYGDPKVDIWS